MNTTCEQCGGYTHYTSDATFVKLPASIVLPPLRSGHSTPTLSGDLGHNATVYYDDDPYSTSDGESFTVRSVMLSDKMRQVALVPKEALALLAWLQQEEETLKALAKEYEG